MDNDLTFLTARGLVEEIRYDSVIRHARRLLNLARTWQAEPRHVSFALSVIANGLRLQGHLGGALNAIREAREVETESTYRNDTTRMIAQYPLLLREAFILGEDRAISLNRPEEAAALLRQVLEMLEAVARSDPDDTLSRARVGTAGRELGDILRWLAPSEALAVYDTALARLAEIRNNVKAARDRALTLAGSSYALRSLGRVVDARRRVQEALAILTETKDHPADTVALDSELYPVLQAEADQHAAEGRLDEALRAYATLIAKVMAATPDIEGDLRDAYALSLLYRDAAQLYRTAGDVDRANALDARRTELWLQWKRTQPDNEFVNRQLAGVDRY